MENKKNKPILYPSNLSRGLERSVENIRNEFRDGFKFVFGIKKAVAVFGSGRSAKDNPHYQRAALLTNLLAKEGFNIVTGGGPGIMEAANKGAAEANGLSIGLNILLPMGQDYNAYVNKGMRFNYFFSRKVMFAAACRYYVFFPGGFGTLDEFFEIINIIHNRKINNPPLLILVGRDYWQGLLEWLKTTVYKKHKAIDFKDFELINLVNSPQEAFEIIKKYHEDHSRNFNQ